MPERGDWEDVLERREQGCGVADGESPQHGRTLGEAIHTRVGLTPTVEQVAHRRATLSRRRTASRLHRAS